MTTANFATSVAHPFMAGASPRRGRLLLTILGLAAFTSSWTGFRISGFNLTDAFLVAAFLVAVGGEFLDRTSVQVRWQFTVLPVVVIVLMAVALWRAMREDWTEENKRERELRRRVREMMSK